jgi:hypothetical protein
MISKLSETIIKVIKLLLQLASKLCFVYFTDKSIYWTKFTLALVEILSIENLLTLERAIINPLGIPIV